MNSLLSIIVPVYNVEEYLPRCIDSILSQTFIDFELILVDDGSQDRSGDICDKYAQKDERVVVIHQSNGGVAAARNRGLDIARGVYITFVDPDDQLGDVDTYGDNIEYFLRNPDMDIIQYPTYSVSGEVIKVLYKPHPQVLYKEQVIKNWYKGNGAINFCIWNKIYKKSVIENIHFPDGMIFEDIVFCSDLMNKAQIVYLSSKGCYKHYYRDGSLTRDNGKNKKLLFDAVWARAIILGKIKKYQFLDIDKIDFFLITLKMFLEISAISKNNKNKRLKIVKSTLRNNIPSLRDILCFFNSRRRLDKQLIKLVLIKLLGIDIFSCIYILVLQVKRSK